jgi:hypothetical protein
MPKAMLGLFVILIALGCSSKSKLITRGIIRDNKYITAKGCIEISAPPGWVWSTEPIKQIESTLASKISRERDVAYVISPNKISLIVIETYQLTWAGRPISPTDITFDSYPDRLRDYVLI